MIYFELSTIFWGYRFYIDLVNCGELETSAKMDTKATAIKVPRYHQPKIPTYIFFVYFLPENQNIFSLYLVFILQPVKSV